MHRLELYEKYWFAGQPHEFEFTEPAGAVMFAGQLAQVLDP